jgi:hypothetical protein
MCQVCGSAAGEESGCEPGKECRLQIEHILPISQYGTDEDHNLRAVCVYYNKAHDRNDRLNAKEALLGSWLCASFCAAMAAPDQRGLTLRPL